MKKLIDRESRDRIAAEVRRFLDGETTAFVFDDAIFDIVTDDPTVNDIVPRLWCLYDDLENHHVALSKPGWDYSQRLLLILESDRHIETVKTTRRWCVTQLIALIAFVGFLPVVWRFGFGQHLFVFAMPFGVISMLIAYWHRSTTSVDNSSLSLMPFSSFAEMRDTYRSVHDFHKSRYPAELSDRKIRSDAMKTIMLIPSHIAWLAFSPLVLFFQILPEHDSQTRVVHVS